MNLGKSLKEEYGIALSSMFSAYAWADKALVFAGLVRVFTLEQAARFLWDGDVVAARKSLETLIVIDGTIGVIENVQLPSGLGGHSINVYYATDVGGKRLMDFCPELQKRARFGRPAGKKLGGIPHELLITEALVRVWPGYEVHDFLPDEEIQRRMRAHQAYQKRHGLEPLKTQVTGDFILVVASPEPERDDIWLQFEAAVKYSARQIDQKPKGMRWFACTTTQADTIEQVTGVRPMIIQEVCSVTPASTTAVGSGAASTGANNGGPGDKRSAVKKRHERVLKALQEIGGVGTAEAIAAHLRCDRANVSRLLNEMSRERVVQFDQASLQPGVKPGRYMAIFCMPDMALPSFHDKLIALGRLEVIVSMARRCWRLVAYNESLRELVFAQDEADKPPIVAIIDDDRDEISAAVVRLKQAHNRWFKTKALLYVVAPVAGRGPILVRHVPSFKITNPIALREKRREPEGKDSTKQVPAQETIGQLPSTIAP